MNVTINQEENKFNVVLEGRLDTTNADQFQKDIEPLMTGEKKKLLLKQKTKSINSVPMRKKS